MNKIIIGLMLLLTVLLIGCSNLVEEQKETQQENINTLTVFIENSSFEPGIGLYLKFGEPEGNVYIKHKDGNLVKSGYTITQIQ